MQTNQLLMLKLSHRTIPQAKKGRGRPKKEKSAIEPSATEDGEKRGRGRPKKEKSAVEPTENAGEKKGRGRPKKEKSGATSDDNDTAVKKGSGKPKNGDEAVKKGRGRPKKDSCCLNWGFWVCLFNGLLCLRGLLGGVVVLATSLLN